MYLFVQIRCLKRSGILLAAMSKMSGSSSSMCAIFIMASSEGGGAWSFSILLIYVKSIPTFAESSRCDIPFLRLSVFNRVPKVLILLTTL